MEEKSSSCCFFFSEDNTHLFAATNVCSDAPSSSSSVAIADSYTRTVETLEDDLTPHDPQNPPSPPDASTFSSSGVPTIVTQSSSESSNAANNNIVTDDDQLQGTTSSSSSVQRVPVLRGGDKRYNGKSNRVDSACFFYHVLRSD